MTIATATLVIGTDAAGQPSECDENRGSWEPAADA